MDSPDTAVLTRKFGKRLTKGEREAIIAACAHGAIKSQIAKDFGIRPETISRILKDVKELQYASNPLSTDYKPMLRDRAVRAITRGLDSTRDVYAAANIGVKVMTGIGEFVSGGNVQVNNIQAMALSWTMPAPLAQELTKVDEQGSQVIDVVERPSIDPT